MKKRFSFFREFKLQQGYILVVTVLFIGAILVATTASLLLLGWAAEQNGVVYNETNQALEAARGCTDIAIQELREDTTYGGDETYGLPNNLGSCTVLLIQGSGTRDRTICTEGTSGGVTFGGVTTRRVLTVIDELFPRVIISRSEEVTSTTECGGAASMSSSSSPGGGSSSSDSSVAVGSSSAASSIASSAASSVASSAASSAASSVATCGNGENDVGEQCDPGLSGCCNIDCTLPAGTQWSCSGTPPTLLCECQISLEGPGSSSSVASSASSAAGFCGDSTCQSGLGEACDLGGQNGLNMGCDAFCQVQSNWSCTPACGGGVQSCSAIISSSSSSAAPGPSAPGPAGPIVE